MGEHCREKASSHWMSPALLVDIFQQSVTKALEFHPSLSVFQMSFTWSGSFSFQSVHFFSPTVSLIQRPLKRVDIFLVTPSGLTELYALCSEEKDDIWENLPCILCFDLSFLILFGKCPQKSANLPSQSHSRLCVGVCECGHVHVCVAGGISVKSLSFSSFLLELHITAHWLTTTNRWITIYGGKNPAFNWQDHYFTKLLTCSCKE